MGRDQERGLAEPTRGAEEWRDVPGLPFRASSRGRIIGPRGKVLAGGLSRDGYRRSPLVRNGHRRVYSHHSLVALAFHGPRPEGFDIDHIDGNRTNNAPHNVRYCPPAENMERLRRPESKYSRYRQARLPLVRVKVEHNRWGSRSLPGESNGRARLTEAQAREILALPRPVKRGRAGQPQPNSLRALAKQYGVGVITIADLIAGRTWSHLRDARTNTNPRELSP